MKKQIFLNLFSALILILASNNIGTIFSMEEDQTPLGYTLYDTLYDAFYEGLSEQTTTFLNEQLKSFGKNDEKEYKKWSVLYISQLRADEERDTMSTEDPIIIKRRENEAHKKHEAQKRRAWFEAKISSTFMTFSLFMGQIAIGLRPQLSDIIPNCMTGLVLGGLISNKNSYAQAMLQGTTLGLWIAYSTWRSHQSTYDHWLRSLFIK